MRNDNRASDQLRPITIQRGFVGAAPGSVLISAGRTTVLCTASIEESVPPWMADRGSGWITAEYAMLPGSTSPRKRRERGGKIDSRGTEIQRLIGRSLRAVVDLSLLGERTIALDCDVMEADGGTRTLSITGALVALVDALDTVRDSLPAYPLRDSLAAVSVGLHSKDSDTAVLLDLDYQEDSSAVVDMNVVMTGGGHYVEIQGTGEEATFTGDELSAMLDMARSGIRGLTDMQRESLGPLWPFDTK